MTSPQPQTEQPDGYPALLDALVAAAVAQALVTYDGIVRDDLIEELPPLLWGLLAESLALSVRSTNLAARTLARLHVDAVVAEARDEPVKPSPVADRDDEVDALRTAVATLLDRASAPEPEPEPEPERTPERPSSTAREDAAAARQRARRERERAEAKRAAERRRAAEFVRRERIAQDVKRAKAAQALARQVRAERQAREEVRVLARLARVQAQQAARDEREDRRIDAALRAAEAREERRAAQRTRVERLARAETYKAADDTAQQAAESAPAVLGWVRLLGPNACPTCRAWWDERPFGVVRPMSVRMKRHPGCDCTRHLVTSREEVTARGYTDKPERVSERWRRAQDRERADARAAAGDASG